MKRCYEEIHIPVPKQKPTSDAGLVPISSLSELVQQVYPVAKKLDRVQSKLYLANYGTDEPILLCAPTGAGELFSFLFIMLMVS